MLQFVIELVVFSAVLSAATIPVGRIARRRGRPRLARRWARRAVLVGSLTAVLGWSSRDLLGKCESANNRECVDIGSAGITMLLLGGFIAWALFSAWLLHND